MKVHRCPILAKLALAAFLVAGGLSAATEADAAYTVPLVQVGAELMRASLDTARLAGRRTLWLGVWERNARAISFYERWQFETVGEHVFRLGSDDQTDLIMARPVAQP